MRVMVSTGGKSKHCALVNRMAGCNASCTNCGAAGLGAHLNIVILFITISRHAVKNLGMLLGLTNLAKPYASTGDCDAGVPVIIHRCVFGLMMLLSAFQRRVVGVLYAFASSTITKSKRPSLLISLAIRLSPS